MPRLRLSFLAALALPLLPCARQAYAQTPPTVNIDYFNFNNTSNFYANGGKDTTGQLTSSFAGPYYTNGTNLNVQNGDTAGYALYLPADYNGDTLTLKTSTKGYNNLALSFATDKSSTGFNSDQLSYSTNNSTFTPFGNPYNPSTSYSKQLFDLSSITALNNASTVYLRITFNGASYTSDYNNIDNFLLTGNTVPTPSGLVSMGIGLGMAGLGALVRRRRQARTDVVSMAQAA